MPVSPRRVECRNACKTKSFGSSSVARSRRFESLARHSATGHEGENMRRAHPRREPEEMLPEYDFSSGVRGKYGNRFPEGAMMVVLDPDVAELFPDPKSVNHALRAPGQIIRDRLEILPERKRYGT